MTSTTPELFDFVEQEVDLWLACGLISLWLGFSNFDSIRLRNRLPPGRQVLTVAFGFVFFSVAPSLSREGRVFEVVCLSWSALSLPIGFVIFRVFGSHGRQVLAKIFWFLLTTLFSLLTAISIRERFGLDWLQSLLLGGLCGLFLAFMPWRRLSRKAFDGFAGIFSKSRRDGLKEPSPVPNPTELAILKKQAELTQELERARVEAKASQKRVERLEKQSRTRIEKRRRVEERLEARRHEVLSTVEKLLTRHGDEETESDRQNGFLMLEAGRLMRFRLEQLDENLPRLELRPHFLSAVSELLEDDDFHMRFFHRKGRKILELFSGFMDGELPLSRVIDAASELEPHEYASSCPLEIKHEDDLGRAITEAWLVPFRRKQERQYEMYLDGEHEHQEFLVLELGSPHRVTLEGFRSIWDKKPWLFFGEMTPITGRAFSAAASSSSRPASKKHQKPWNRLWNRLWKKLSRFSRRS